MKHFILESAKIMRHVADNNVKVRLDSIYCFLQFVWLGFYKGDACLHSRAMFCTRHWHVRLSQFLCHRAHSQRNESRDLPALCQCAPISTAGSTEAMKVHSFLKAVSAWSSVDLTPMTVWSKALELLLDHRSCRQFADISPFRTFWLRFIPYTAR